MEKSIHKNDCVLFRGEDGTPSYGYVVDKHKKQGTCEVMGIGEYETVTLPEEALTVIAPVGLSVETMGRILRYEVPMAELARTIVPIENFRVEGTYRYGLEDMVAAVQNLSAAHLDAETFNQWLELVFQLMHFDYSCQGEPERDEAHRYFDAAYPLNDAAFAEDIFNTLSDLCYTDPLTGTDDGLFAGQILEDLAHYRRSETVRRHLWSRENLDNLFYIADETMGEGWTEEELSEARALIFEYADKGFVYAIQAMAYASYGGSRLMDCDWERSRSALERLMALGDAVSDMDKCIYANSLGAIYYYGRTTNGVPDYERAFAAFSLAAAGGIYDAMCKLSDMYAKGQGVPKNTQAATNLVRLVYEQCDQRIRHGDFRSDFADAAVRMGKLAQEGYLSNDPYYYFTLADYAIRKRLPYHQRGDGAVYKGIQKELARIRETRPLRTRSELTYDNFPPIVDELFRKYSCEVTVKKHKSNLKITVRRLPRPGQTAPKQIFECSPDDGYCALISEVTFVAKGVKKAPDFGKKTHFRADGIDFDLADGESDRYSFCYHGERVFGAGDDADHAGLVDVAGQEREAVVERIFRADRSGMLNPENCYCRIIRRYGAEDEAKREDVRA